MLKLIKELFHLLTPSQRRRFYLLQILVTIMAMAEVVGVASIAPFMALVGDISVLEGNNLLARIYIEMEMEKPYDFIFFVGLVVLATLILSALLSILTTWRLAMFAAEVGTENADRLFTHYLKQNWLFHASGSSSQLVKQIATEAPRVTDLIILPLILMVSKIVLVIFFLIAIVVYNPVVALTGLVVLGFFYLLIYVVARKRLMLNGNTLSEVATLRFRLMSEAFGGIKDILLLNRKDNFIKQFERSGKEFAYARGNNHVLWQVPRYFMELLAFGAMIVLVLYLISSYQGNLGTVLPILAVYALAGFKLLPAFQQIYASAGQIKGNIAAFEAIRSDLLNLQAESQVDASHPTSDTQMREQLAPRNSITLSNIKFTYPNKEKPALNQFSMHIAANSVVGIVGPSGSGKSTAIDILLSLVKPQEGELRVDKTLITESNYQSWQKSIGFVPQSIFLSEGSIAENVAFGIPENEINFEQVNKALDLAHLTELLSSLKQGVSTKVGERGVQLSGGQRQRIGIARALYSDAKVLVFDEATSALDGVSEKLIMDAIHEFSGKKTIIMIAHRLKTVQKCDQIFYIDNGKVLDQGTYEFLINKNENFRRMASHA